MRRVSHATKQIDKHGSGKHGFTDGEASTQTPPTAIVAADMDAHQEEIANVVEGAGITLDPNDNTQLLAAITALIGASGTTISPASFGTDQSDWNPTGWATAATVRITTSADAAINSAAVPSGVGARPVKLLVNTTGYWVTLKHDHTSGTTAAQRFVSPGGRDFRIPPYGSNWIVYDATTARWRAFGRGNNFHFDSDFLSRLYVYTALQTFGAGLTVSSGNLGVTTGNITAAAGNITATDGALQAFGSSGKVLTSGVVDCEGALHSNTGVKSQGGFLYGSSAGPGNAWTDAPRSVKFMIAPCEGSNIFPSVGPPAAEDHWNPSSDGKIRCASSNLFLRNYRVPCPSGGRVTRIRVFYQMASDATVAATVGLFRVVADKTANYANTIATAGSASGPTGGGSAGHFELDTGAITPSEMDGQDGWWELQIKSSDSGGTEHVHGIEVTADDPGPSRHFGTPQ